MRNKLVVFLLAVLCPVLIAQQALNNDGVLKLLKAGLSEDLVISTINASPAAYDTSANGIVALKTAGASDKVIAAIVVRASAGSASPVAAIAAGTAAAAASTLPPGIDDVGVYYKDKTGVWVSLQPEIVNFKTGGVLKSIATNGILKGDMNGHVNGAHAAQKGTLPFTLAVCVASGVDIAEYQLLKLRENSSSREFRSVTGGVFHASGGAKRDMIEFHATKLAPRVYQITLEQSLGKGEYGLLPPGATSSSNMASGGKLYSISIIE